MAKNGEGDWYANRLQLDEERSALNWRIPDLTFSLFEEISDRQESR